MRRERLGLLPVRHEVAQPIRVVHHPRSSGITAQSLIVDAGMSINYFDADLIRRAMRPDG